jgi:hypothetical protein
VGHVAVREHALVDLHLADDGFEPVLCLDRDPFRIAGPREGRRKPPAVDVRDLRCREGNDPLVGVVLARDQEVVEVTPCSTQDHYTLLAHDRSLLRFPRHTLGIGGRGDSAGVETPTVKPGLSPRDKVDVDA